MGMPSASIALQELMRMIFFLKRGDLEAMDEVFWCRVGTSGGVGLPGGTVVVSSEGLMADLKPYRLLRGGEGEYWFDGHFPKKPILPGVAQLTLVADILHRALGTPVVVEQVSRVRFKQMIQPDEVIAISLSPTNSDAAAYGFRLANSAELICSGTLKMAEPPRGDVRTHVLRSEG
jgi:uridine phosphorylase